MLLNKNYILNNNKEEKNTMCTKKEFKRFSFEELVKVCESNYIKYKFDVVSYLIGYNGIIDEIDWENIRKLYRDDYVD